MEIEKRSNVVGLILLFVTLSIVGSILALFYIAFQDWVPNLWVAAGAGVAFGFVLAWIVKTCKKQFKITSTVGCVVVVCLALFIIHYLKWNMFFSLWWYRIIYWEHGLDLPHMFHDFGGFLDQFIAITAWHITDVGEFINDFRIFNEAGTWTTDFAFDFYARGENVHGPVLTVIWLAEFLIISIIPIVAAAKSAGIFLASMDSWARASFHPYDFTVFTEEELDRISQGETNIIINKPLVSYGGLRHNVADLYVGTQMTDYIGIFQTSGDAMLTTDNPGKLVCIAKVGREKAKELDEKLRLQFRGAAEPANDPYFKPEASINSYNEPNTNDSDSDNDSDSGNDGGYSDGGGSND